MFTSSAFLDFWQQYQKWIVILAIILCFAWFTCLLHLWAIDEEALPEGTWSETLCVVVYNAINFPVLGGVYYSYQHLPWPDNEAIVFLGGLIYTPLFFAALFFDALLYATVLVGSWSVIRRFLRQRHK